jgi:hypothetical protein
VRESASVSGSDVAESDTRTWKQTSHDRKSDADSTTNPNACPPTTKLDSPIALMRPHLAYELGCASSNLQIDRILRAAHDGVERTHPDHPIHLLLQNLPEAGPQSTSCPEATKHTRRGLSIYVDARVWCHSQKRTRMIRTTCVLRGCNPGRLIPGRLTPATDSSIYLFLVSSLSRQ